MKRLFFFGVIIVAIFLRFWQLASIPPSLTWDEVAWGYSAYSIGIDARDEFGRLLPVTYIESFGDFKPPVYMYLDTLPIKFFGLNEFAVRFPSALFGVLTVLVTYLLVKRIFGHGKEILALLSAGILAISPWHMLLSRAAFEANVATFFIALGVYVYLVAIEKNKWLLSVSAVSFILSMYTFNSARIVVPLLVIGLLIGTWKEIFPLKKESIIAGILGVALIIPLAQFVLTPQAQLRFNEVNIFSDISVIERVNEQVAVDDNAWWSRVIHNRRLAYSVEYIRHYFDNLTPKFLFIKGDGNPKFSMQDVGQMYLWEIPFFLAGGLFLFRKREKYWWIIPYWLVVAIIPAGTARETPHALRIESALPTFQIITAYGVFYLLSGVKRVWRVPVKQAVIICLSVLVVFNFLYFTYNYFTHYPSEFSGEWQYGYKEAIAYTESVKDRYDAIYFTNELGRPYMYVLFYGKYHPEFFRKNAHVRRDTFGFVHVEKMGKYHFFDKRGTIEGNGDVLIVDTPNNIPDKAIIQYVVSLLNGAPALIAYTL